MHKNKKKDLYIAPFLWLFGWTPAICNQWKHPATKSIIHEQPHHLESAKQRLFKNEGGAIQSTLVFITLYTVECSEQMTRSVSFNTPSNWSEAEKSFTLENKRSVSWRRSNGRTVTSFTVVQHLDMHLTDALSNQIYSALYILL